MKNLNVQKRIAAAILGCSPKRVKFDQEHLEDIKQAITRVDLKGLINDSVITTLQKKGVSRARANKIKIQKSKGNKKGHGSRKGKAGARTPKKQAWMRKIRTQREFIAELKKSNLVTNTTYRMLYRKSKGGFFRSRRHIKLYLTEQKLFEIKG